LGKTTFTLNQDCFTSEVTEAFLVDFEKACEQMELQSFTELFVKYDLEFIADYKEVFDLIADVMTSWKSPGEETKLLEVSQHDSKCLFCNIGKAVKIYSWTSIHQNAKPPMNRVVYKNKVGFFFGYEQNQLREFGVCNGYIK